METLGLDQMKMGWISHNLVCKQIFLTKNVLDRQLSVSFIN